MVDKVTSYFPQGSVPERSGTRLHVSAERQVDTDDTTTSHILPDSVETARFGSETHLQQREDHQGGRGELQGRCAAG